MRLSELITRLQHLQGELIRNRPFGVTNDILDPEIVINTPYKVPTFGTLHLTAIRQIRTHNNVIVITHDP